MLGAVTAVLRARNLEYGAWDGGSWCSGSGSRVCAIYVYIHCTVQNHGVAADHSKAETRRTGVHCCSFLREIRDCCCTSFGAADHAENNTLHLPSPPLPECSSQSHTKEARITEAPVPLPAWTSSFCHVVLFGGLASSFARLHLSDRPYLIIHVLLFIT